MDISIDRKLSLWKSYFGPKTSEAISSILEGNRGPLLNLIILFEKKPNPSPQARSFLRLLKTLQEEGLLEVGGFYRHRKGGLYEAIGSAVHSETEENLVIYQSCTTGIIWARPHKMFQTPGRFTRIEVSKESGLLLKSKY